ncbi:MAG: hypothetical protein J6U01_02140 [Clostridia bacterium]|nr:hypothetical protein [Clostridia bacterium]
MTDKQTALHQFFADRAKHLQIEIDTEIVKIGGEDMLISREDLIHWVYHAREEVKTYQTICRMLKDQTEGKCTEKILRELRETVEKDQTDIERIHRKQEEEQKALARLREEAEYYQQALEVLGRQLSED